MTSNFWQCLKNTDFNTASPPPNYTEKSGNCHWISRHRQMWINLKRAKKCLVEWDNTWPHPAMPHQPDGWVCDQRGSHVWSHDHEQGDQQQNVPGKEISRNERFAKNCCFNWPLNKFIFYRTYLLVPVREHVSGAHLLSVAALLSPPGWQQGRLENRPVPDVQGRVMVETTHP